MKPHIITLTLAVTLGLGLLNLGASSRGQLSKGRDLLQPAQITADSRNDRIVSARGRGHPWLNLGRGQTALTVLLAKPQTFFTVINTNDAGAGSLRQAIIDANNSPGADVINFQIGQGTPTISLSSSLPEITDPVTIDGGTGGASRVELRGPNLGGNQACLVITAGSSVVRGLVINRFLNGEIELDSSNNVIENCFIGTDTAGNSAPRNHLFGVKISNGSHNLIGGTVTGAANLIAGHSRGIWITGSDASSNRVQGNLIGTNAAGTDAIFNSTGVSIESNSFSNEIGGAQAGARNVISANGIGVQISSAGNIVQGNFIGTNAAGTAALGNGTGVLVSQPNNTIGGTTVGAGNVIAGNSDTGLFIFDTTGSQVQGNLIGTNAGGDALGNLRWGVRISALNNTIGGTGSGAGNTIAFNGLAGVAVSTGSNTGNAIRSNSVHSNAGLGIDLNEDGVTQNDSCDLDLGPNNRQNFPELSSAVSAGGNTTIQGTLNSTAQRNFTIEFFFNTTCDPSGFGEGRSFIGSTTVTTDSSCNATFNVGFPFSSPTGSSITATATDSSGNTSEFSRCVQVGGGSCTYRLTPANQSFPASGGTNSVTVTAPVGCQWAASSRDTWLMITSGNSGSGNGTINYTVAPNLDPTQRFGSMTIAGQSFFVTQAAGCSFSITPTLDGFGINGGTGSVTVNTAAGCAWTASTNASWLTLIGANGGTGNGTVNYSVVANSGTYRTATMTIAGRTFTVAQAGSCNATIGPTSRSFFSGGGPGTVYVRAPAGCNWTANSNSAWLTITSADTGRGDGTITYSVAPNGTGAPRTGSLSVAGELFTVTQDAAPATIFIDDATITEGDNGSRSLSFFVHLSAASSVPVTVAYATSDGTAMAGSDYGSSTGTLNFAAGHNDWAFVTVRIIADTDIEPDETFFVNLFNPTNATIARAQAVGTIINDDRRTVSIGQSNLQSVVEGNSGQRQAVFNVVLSAPATVDVTVHYQTEDHTATAGSDYLAASGTLTFPANSTTTTLPVNVTILGDTDIEAHEIFYLRLSNPTNATIDRDIAEGEIMNDDGPRTLSINDVAVSNDFATSANFTVSLSAVSDDLVVVSYATADGTAIAGIDYKASSSNNFDFAPHTHTAFGLGIDIIGDDNRLAIHEPRTFTVNLSNPVGATIADGQGVCTIHDHIPTFCELNPNANSCLPPSRQNDCPITRSSHDNAAITLSRQFRDEVLAQTPRGRKYTQAYYRCAGEVVELLVFNPRLLWRTSQALERYKPIMQTLVSRAEAATESAQRAEISISPQDLEAVDDLLKDIEAEGSQQLRQTLAEIRRDLRDPQAQAEFGVKVRSGDLDLPSLPNDGAKAPMQSASNYPPTDSTMAARATEAYGNLPLRFESNQGQASREVNFISRGNGYTLSLAPNETAFQLRSIDVGPGNFGKAVFNPQSDIRNPRSSLLRMKLLGSNPTPRVAGLDRLPTRSNYFIGSDAKSWRTNISNFSKVQYEQIYPGVNLDYYGNQRQLEYDFTVTPGADPATIKLGIDGANKVEIDDQGDLVLHTPSGIIRQRRPLIYQEVDGIRQEICGGYALQKTQDTGLKSQGSYLVAFRVGAYDRSRPLVIDPVLVYSTYLGGGGEEKGNAITVDAAGNAYVIGFTDSTNFPVANPRQASFGGPPQDVFVAKLNPAGTGLVYATYLGGEGQDHGSGIAVDTAGNAYITGYTGSRNFPVANGVQPTLHGSFNAFVAKLDATGANLAYSTYLGGTIGEFGSGIAVDAAGNAYVTGVTTSTNFPTTNALQPAFGGGLSDAFVTKLSPGGTQLIYSTYLGGSGTDGATSIALDTTGNVHLTGVTSSTNFPLANPLQGTFGGGDLDAFVTKLNAAGAQLIYSTYLGGDGSDRGFRLAVDANGNSYVAGDTDSANFPVTGPLQDFGGGGGDAFIAKFNSAGVMIYDTYLGGTGLDGATAIAVDAAGRAYVTGYTESANFPTVNPLAGSVGGGFNAFVTKLNAAGTAIAYSTYLGGSGSDAGFGIAVDSSGSVYVLGQTDSRNFPTVNPSQPNNAGGLFDLFISKLVDILPASHDISGLVLDPQGNALANSTITISGSQSRTTTTGSGGAYAVPNLPAGGSYTVTPSLSGYAFNPPSRNIEDLVADQAANFTALKISGSTFLLNAAGYTVTEGCSVASIAVNRTGDISHAATVDYETKDATALQRTDYTLASGTLSFSAGETSKSFSVLITKDAYTEGNETVNLSLSNPTGGATLGAPSTVTLTIIDDPTVVTGTQPIDDAGTFVCQHYHDFLNRQSDGSGLAFWTNEMTSCGSNQACIELKRINVSAAFFLSIEFQNTGYLVERIYKAAYGNAGGPSTFGGTHQLSVPIVRFNEFLPDTQRIGQGVVVGQTDWETLLENNKQAFALEFVQRARFTTALATTLTPTQFVDALFANAGVPPSATERNAAINEFGSATNTGDIAARARALRRVAENATLITNEFNRAFVLMQFFGYLRRNPNDLPDTDYSGYDFWLTKLNQFNGNFNDAEMVKAFITSAEYRNRFGP